MRVKVDGCALVNSAKVSIFSSSFSSESKGSARHLCRRNTRRESSTKPPPKRIDSGLTTLPGAPTTEEEEDKKKS